jgi:hypothetical protein
MNRAERRNKKKGNTPHADWSRQGPNARRMPGQARARTEKGLIRPVAQAKGRRS